MQRLWYATLVICTACAIFDGMYIEYIDTCVVIYIWVPLNIQYLNGLNLRAANFLPLLFLYTFGDAFLEDAFLEDAFLEDTFFLDDAFLEALDDTLTGTSSSTGGAGTGLRDAPNDHLTMYINPTTNNTAANTITATTPPNSDLFSAYNFFHQSLLINLGLPSSLAMLSLFSS